MSAALLFALISTTMTDGVYDSKPDPSSSVQTKWVELEVDSAWCGAKALLILAKHYGLSVTEEEVITACDPLRKSDGYLSLEELSQACKRLSLFSTPVKCDFDWLAKSNLPIITLHRTGLDGKNHDRKINHFMVFCEEENGVVKLINPFNPYLIEKTTVNNFKKSWTGDAMIVAKDEPTVRNLMRNSQTSTLLAIVLMQLGVCLALFLLVKKKRGPLVAASLLLITLTGCSEKPEAVSLYFPEQTFDAGSIVGTNRATIVSHKFNFSNRSKSPLKIVAAKPGCSCSQVFFPTEIIQPGSSGVVELVVDHNGRIGSFSTEAVLQLDKDGSQPIVLEFKSYFVPPIRTTPAVFDFGSVIAGVPVERTVKVHVALQPGESAPLVLGQHNLRKDVTYAVSKESVVSLKSASSFKPVRFDEFDVTARLQPAKANEVIRDTLTLKVKDREADAQIYLQAKIEHPDVLIDQFTINFGVVSKADSIKTVHIVDRLHKVVPALVISPRTSLPGITISTEEDTKNSTLVLVIKCLNTPDLPRFFRGEVELVGQHSTPPVIISITGVRG